MTKSTRLTWSGSQQAQREADEAFARLKSKSKPKKQHKYKSKKRFGNTKPNITEIDGKVIVVDYQKYLRSSRWKRKRNQAREHYGNKCAHCGRKKLLQVHHKTYERVGREEMRDLELLCEECHKARHGSYSMNDSLSVEFRELVSGF